MPDNEGPDFALPTVSSLSYTQNTDYNAKFISCLSVRSHLDAEWELCLLGY